ncbi:MAG: NHL repeat-containing protein [Dermatophilaceae bacterium]
MTTHDVSTASGPVPESPPSPEPDADSGVGAADALTPEQERRRRRKRILLALLALLVLLFAILFGWYLSTRKPLSQLPGLTQEKLPHYVSSFYGVTRPMGVAVSPSGERIYVTESDGTRLVRVYDKAGNKVGTLAPPKSTGAGHVPVYVAVDPVTSNVYVSDRPTQAVYIYDAKGAYLRTFAPRGDLGGGWQPLGLAFDKPGNLYVTDVSSTVHRVLVFGRDGTLRRTLGSTGKLSFPNGIAIDPQGTAYVSDSNNGRLVTFDPAGTLGVKINRGVGQGDLGLPRGVAIDTSNRLYVVDTSAHAVKIYRLAASKAPTFIGSFGDEGSLDGTFEYPNGVATDTRSRIYVTDRENNRVQVWSY